MPDSVVVVIPALNEQQRIEATVASAATIPGVDAVIVTDDGSTDRTAAVAGDAGAIVVRHPSRRGKAAAMITGAREAVTAGRGAAALLFLDADLEATAAAAAPLVVPVLDGRADMTIAILPKTAPGGGHGFVVRLATRGIVAATGWTPTQPLSGQRCITRDLFDAVQPLARGFGVETGLTIDALRRGAKVLECEVPISHRVTGAGWRDQRHRARQYRDVWLALITRRVWPRREQRAR
ncbi:MAG TPA: glycosyltransferase [Mycobacteriales bacterium]|jgi:glycosyltransferase involved in cell wall biosynthesis|nr:glycosyltransferase [Mycobacteriales bacterium]HVX70982.1 glycosyltransferase [Mycobacteriales bacterium]